jgi:hypothetical protein
MSHTHMNVEIRAEAMLIPEKEYINGIFVALLRKDLNVSDFLGINAAFAYSFCPVLLPFWMILPYCTFGLS